MRWKSRPARMLCLLWLQLTKSREADGLVDAVAGGRITQPVDPRRPDSHAYRRDAEVEGVAVYLRVSDVDAGAGMLMLYSELEYAWFAGFTEPLVKIVERLAARAVPTQRGGAVDASIAHGVGAGEAVTVGQRVATQQRREARAGAGRMRVGEVLGDALTQDGRSVAVLTAATATSSATAASSTKAAAASSTRCYRAEAAVVTGRERRGVRGSGKLI